MAKIPEMRYKIKEDKIIVELPITSQGKYRCKRRSDIQDFGMGFAPKTTIITSDSYLEWQIGYDTIIGNEGKRTTLNSDEFVFTGANRKLKYPYELSEIVYYMCKNKWISKEEILKIYQKIEENEVFLQEKYLIDVKKEETVTLNKIKFLSSSTKLPTFIMNTNGSKMLIEIMIQKQQYATGVQPMLYLDVPVDAFYNKDDIIGHTSSETPNGILIFDKNEKDILLNLLICFGMCSKAHNHDVKEILKVIIKNAF